MFQASAHRVSFLMVAGFWAVLSGCNMEPIPYNTTYNKDTLYVSIQIDAEFNPVDAARHEAGNDVQGFDTLTNELKNRGIVFTLMATADFLQAHSTKFTPLYLLNGAEIGLHGQTTNEQLDNMTYDEQKALLTQARDIVSRCLPCKVSWPVVGFRGQGYGMNEDTYRVLDELGITYNSTFRTGVTFTAGHDNDTAPYPVDGHGFWAVPITTVTYGDNNTRIELCDVTCGLDHQYTPEQYGQILTQAVDQAVQTKQPLVLIVHGWYTGDEGQSQYLPQFRAFLDNLQSRDNVRFVTTKTLVEWYQTGIVTAPSSGT